MNEAFYESTHPKEEQGAMDIDDAVALLKSALDSGPNGVDDSEYPSLLLEACQVSETAHTAHEKIREYIYDERYREVAVVNLFRAIRYNSVDGLFDAVLMRDIFRETYAFVHEPAVGSAHELTRYEAARILDQFYEELSLLHSFGDDVHEEVNFLTLKYFQGFAEEFGVGDNLDEGVRVSAHIDEDSCVPFVVPPNQFAIFNEDNTEMYVLDSEQSDEIAYAMAEPMSKLGYGVVETKMGSVLMPHIPQELYLYSEHIRQAGTPIGDLLPTKDQKEIAAYRILQKTHFKEVLEGEFGVCIEELPIKERYYFLNFLNKKTISEIKAVQEFTRLHGTDGMRAFLSLERGHASLGDRIISFGRQSEHATEVFRSYRSLLDEAAGIEELIHREFNCTTLDCELLAKQAREYFLNDIQKYITSIITNDVENQPPDLSQKVIQAKSLAAAIATYMACGNTTIEGLSGLHKNEYVSQELVPDQVDTFIDFYTRNYRRLGYEQSAINALVSDLRDRIAVQQETKVRTWEFAAGTVLAFAVLSENSAVERAHVSGLNISPELKITSAAKKLAEEIVTGYSEKGWIVDAESSPRNFKGYAEMGWVATAAHRDPLGAEPYLFAISVFPNHSFESKRMSRKELLDRVTLTEQSSESDGIVVWKTDNHSGVPPQLSNGYVVTRLFTVRERKSEDQSYIFVLERAPATLHPREIQTQNAA